MISGKKEKSMISEHEKACSDKIAQLEESLKKKTQVYTYHKLNVPWVSATLLSFPHKSHSNINIFVWTQDDKTSNILKKTLSSFLENDSGEDFLPDDWGIASVGISEKHITDNSCILTQGGLPYNLPSFSSFWK